MFWIGRYRVQELAVLIELTIAKNQQNLELARGQVQTILKSVANHVEAEQPGIALDAAPECQKGARSGWTVPLSKRIQADFIAVAAFRR